MVSIKFAPNRSLEGRGASRQTSISVYPKVNEALAGKSFGSVLDGLASFVDGYDDFEEVWRSPLSSNDQQFVATHNDWAMIGQDMLAAMHIVRSNLNEDIREKLPDVKSQP